VTDNFSHFQMQQAAALGWDTAATEQAWPVAGRKTSALGTAVL